MQYNYIVRKKVYQNKFGERLVPSRDFFDFRCNFFVNFRSCDMIDGCALIKNMDTRLSLHLHCMMKLLCVDKLVLQVYEFAIR